MLDGEKLHPSQYYDLHLVWHRLNEIVVQADDELTSFDQLVEEVSAARRLVRSLLNGYEKDAEA